MAESYTAQLTRVQAAIAAIEEAFTGTRMPASEVTLADGRKVRREERSQVLAQLYAREERLIPLAGREGRGGGISISRGAGA